MIEALVIENFKSVRRLRAECRRVNLFIGEPNTGKSNILEALGLLSWCARPTVPLNDFVRFQLAQNLFYDNQVDAPIRIVAEGKTPCGATVSFDGKKFQVQAADDKGRKITLAYQGHAGGGPIKSCEFIKAYRFRHLDKFENPELGALACPSANNLVSLIQGSKALRERVQNYFEEFGLKLFVKPHEGIVEIVKQGEGILIAYPYALVSDTLQRMVFYTAAMETNKGATLVFEEPEAHAFPYHTKLLGEEIALDKSNQYFIATHNPYLLAAVVEKADKEDVAVFATSFRNGETRARRLTAEHLCEALDLGADPFFMTERFAEDAP